MVHSLRSVAAAAAVRTATPRLQVPLRSPWLLSWRNYRSEPGRVFWEGRKTMTKKKPSHSPQDDASAIRGISLTATASAPPAGKDEASRAEHPEDKHREQLKVLMAAGGTGGHVYPAIAIADEIRNLCNGGDDDPRATVQFVGTVGRMEWAAVPRAGYEITAIPAVALRRPLLTSVENLLVPAKLLMALLSSWKLLRRLKPHVVVGTGGYVSGPVCLVAAVMFGCPVVVQEQNAYAGVANRVLGRVAAAIFVAFSAAIPYFPKEKCILQGNPTRKALRQSTSFSTPDARRYFFSPPEGAGAEQSPDGGGMAETTTIQNQGKQADELELELVVLILGGSLGARAVNLAVLGMAVAMLEKYPTRGIIWQTGGRYYREVVDQVGIRHPRLVIVPYVDAMHVAYAAADLVVARAGAITCSELLVVGKPAILIPSTNVAEDHQAKNAVAMVEHGSARVIPESSLDSQALSEVLCELLDDPERLKAMASRALAAATPDAATRIAEHVMRLARHHRSAHISGSGLREGPEAG